MFITSLLVNGVTMEKWANGFKDNTKISKIGSKAASCATDWTVNFFYGRLFYSSFSFLSCMPKKGSKETTKKKNEEKGKETNRSPFWWPLLTRGKESGQQSGRAVLQIGLF